jgi:uncharacterized protein YdeI (YjbR/CyaY-like superfamily)
MGKKIKEVDQYIKNSNPFAQPILEHLRELVHTAAPDVGEVIKWGFPNFEYKGNVCSMAAFKAHCAFSFWKGAIMQDPHNILTITNKEAMGSLGRITSIKDLPSKKILTQYIKAAVQLNEAGIKLVKKTPKITSKEISVPEDFANILSKNKKAKEVFNKFSPSHKKEYIEWINEAKREETRNKRINTAIEWITEGKGRNWKYER